jgi:hypothetical protein
MQTNSEQDFQMKALAESFSNQSFGRTGVCAPIALAKSPTPFAEKPRGQDSMNVTSVNDNLQLPPVLSCIAQSCLYGNGCR